MAINDHGQRLKAFREAAGLSQRALAREIGEQYSNVRYWETSGKLPRSDVLIPIAIALGITLEELLEEPKPKRPVVAGGRVGKTVETLLTLPRRQQARILDVVDDMIAARTASSS